MDFAALGTEWQAMSDEEQAAQKNAYTKITGDREGFRAIVAAGA